MNAFERETVITASDGDGLVRVWTAQKSVIGRLRRHQAFTETNSGFYDGSSEWAEFTIPADRWHPATGVKRVVRHSVAAIEANKARLAAWRQSKEAAT